MIADQIVTAARQTDPLVGGGGNQHVTEDECLGEIVEFAANGRHAPAYDEVIGEAFEPRVRVLPADPDAPARYPHEPQARTDRLGCDRCGQQWGPTRRDEPPPWFLPTYDGRDGSRHVLWIAAGTVVVEVTMCLVCKEYLDENFAPVVWK